MKTTKKEFKTITVSFDTWKGLTNIKYEMLFNDIDSVIKHLLKIQRTFSPSKIEDRKKALENLK